MVKEKTPQSVQNEAERGFCNRIVKPIASTLRDRDTARRVPKFRFLHVVESGNDMQLRWDPASQHSVFTGNKCRFRRTALNRNPVLFAGSGPAALGRCDSSCTGIGAAQKRPLNFLPSRVSLFPAKRRSSQICKWGSLSRAPIHSRLDPYN